MERLHVLRQGKVSMALDKTSRIKRLNQAFVTFEWLVSCHLMTNGVIADIKVAAQDPSGRLYSATAPVIERHQASKPEHIGQHGTSHA